MTDPRTILWQARQGPVPTDWHVFTKRRGKLKGFFRGTSDDPDPLLVITPDGTVEYTDERHPPTVVDFYALTDITLQVRGQSFSDSTMVNLAVWIDLQYRDGTKAKWRSASFPGDLRAVQGFIEAYGAHKALLGG
ncbi:hypothetical protein [Kitasatospora sp. NPDC005751]|uniref:hypothetical protein n=1 Tax=unclassified Kitasatospora TaxID=2633591 RepID=UPI00340E70C1